MKFPKMIIPIIAIGAIGMASFAAPPFSSIEKTPEIKGSVFYSMKNVPSGFELVSGYNNSNLPELTGKQNPNPLQNASGTCKFSPQISYLPDEHTGRGDKYLTLSYIYENAQASPHLPSAIKKMHVSAGDTTLEVLRSSYDVAPAKDSSGNEKGYYRTVAVRAMDTMVTVPYVAGSESKGIPTIVLTYDCQSMSDYNESDFSALLSSVNVNLMDTVSNEVPVKDTVKPTDSPTASELPTDGPSATATDSSTASGSKALETKSGPPTTSKPSK